MVSDEISQPNEPDYPVISITQAVEEVSKGEALVKVTIPDFRELLETLDQDERTRGRSLVCVQCKILKCYCENLTVNNPLDMRYQIEFLDVAFFRQAKFLWNVDLKGVKFLKGAYIDDARFDEEAYLVAEFTAEASFMRAKFLNLVHFQGAQFTCPANFLGVRFCGAAIFRQAEFPTETYFQGVLFCSDADFQGAKMARRSTRNIRIRSSNRFLRRREATAIRV